jgi:multidrug efflux pump subunit AcrA (membrane-fusion protein)
VLNPGASPGPADQSGTSAAANGGAAYLPLAIHPDRPWDTGLAGHDVRITITAAATNSAVLSVPEAAISSGADMRTTVTVQDTSGALRTVAVQVGVSADGMVQVVSQGGLLADGDRVVVGQ